ncbi:cation-transporting P-type ATPase, partial [Lacticaseibacillus paracasei]
MKKIEHKCPIEDLYKGHFKEVIIDPEQGLKTEDVRKLQEFYGPNRLTPKKKVHWIINLFKEMVGQFSLMLWA